MAFVKLDCKMLRSSLWVDREGRSLFVTALLMAELHEVREPTPQLEVRTLTETGYIVPPGWYGLVPSAGPGIVRLDGLEGEIGLATLERLCAPDPESRSRDHDGRRLARIDGGYLVLNYVKHRDRDHSAKERQQRFRDRKKTATETPSDTRNALRQQDNALRVTHSRVQSAELESDTTTTTTTTTAPNPAALVAQPLSRSTPRATPRAPTPPPPPSWISVVAGSYERTKGVGSFPHGKAGKILKPLHEAGHTGEEIALRLTRYMAWLDDAKFFSFQRFRETFGDYECDEPAHLRALAGYPNVVDEYGCWTEYGERVTSPDRKRATR